MRYMLPNWLRRLGASDRFTQVLLLGSIGLTLAAGAKNQLHEFAASELTIELNEAIPCMTSSDPKALRASRRLAPD